MRIAAACALLVILCLPASAQLDSQVGPGLPSRHPSYGDFVQTFRKDAPGLTSKGLDKLFGAYSEFFTQALDTTRLMNRLEGRSTSQYPLERLKNEPFYPALIRQLVESPRLPQRQLAYMTIGAANDTRWAAKLRSALRREKDKVVRLWAGLALLEMRDSDTTGLFDFLVRDEDFSDPHLLPLYLNLDRDSLRQTAYARLESPKRQARILAVQSLATTGLNPTTESKVKTAVRTWDLSLKGYAIYTMKELQMGGLSELLVPLLTDARLKGIAMEALANSPSAEDQAYVLGLPVNEESLDAWLSSKNPEVVRHWLRVVRTQKVPPDYKFFATENDLLRADTLLDDVRVTLRDSPNLEIRQSLSTALKGRTDAETLTLLVGLLSDPDDTVRYWAGDALQEVTSPLLAAQLPALLRNPQLRTSVLTKLALTNRLDALQDVYDPFLGLGSEQEWRRSALEYLAVYPLPRHGAALRTILEQDEDPFSRRYAALGLGTLRDDPSVESIIRAVAKEPAHDQNAVAYLIALAKIGGERANGFVKKYEKSSNPQVHELVKKLLANPR